VGGFYGKLPARGDFVRHGLPGDFVQAWDGWVQSVLPAVREGLGAEWDSVWSAAPGWCFALPGGVCGSASVTGVWMPSVDRVGRAFPLVIAVCGAVDAVDAQGFRAGAAEQARAAIVHRWPPEMLRARIAELRVAGTDAADEADGTALWWRSGESPPAIGPGLPLAMPDAATLATMLCVATRA